MYQPFSVDGLSDDAPFDAPRTAPVKPPLRLFVLRCHVARSRRVCLHAQASRTTRACGVDDYRRGA